MKAKRAVIVLFVVVFSLFSLDMITCTHFKWRVEFFFNFFFFNNRNSIQIKQWIFWLLLCKLQCLATIEYDEDDRGK